MILALFDRYFWLFNNSHAKMLSQFCDQRIIGPSISNVFIKFRWPGEKLTRAEADTIVLHKVYRYVKAWTSWYLDGTAVNFFSWSAHMRRKLWTQITSMGWIFWNMISYNVTKFKSRSIKWGVKLYFEFTRSWSLSCPNIAIFWQITRN